MKHIVILIMMVSYIFGQEGTLMIEVFYKGKDYSIKRAWVLEQNFPPTRQSPTEKKTDIIIELKDIDGNIVDKLRLFNPNIVRGILAVGGGEGHKNLTKSEGSFLVRYAYDKALKYIHIVNVDEEVEVVTTSNINKPPSTRALNNDMEFQSFLEKN